MRDFQLFSINENTDRLLVQKKGLQEISEIQLNKNDGHFFKKQAIRTRKVKKDAECNL